MYDFQLGDHLNWTPSFELALQDNDGNNSQVETIYIEEQNPFTNSTKTHTHTQTFKSLVENVTKIYRTA